MQDFSASPRELIASFWRNRSLIYALSKREVLGRYKGSYFGIFWSFINPLFMLMIYTFVFSIIFKARWNVGGDSKLEFAIILMCGLMAFNLFSECLLHAPSIIVSNSNYVKKVVFPLEILPLVGLISSIFHFGISFIVWLIFSWVFFKTPPVSIFLLPIIIAPLIFFTMGVSWVLASLGVYLRDLNQVISLLVTALMFLTPIFYPLSSIPDQYQILLLANPLTKEIEMVRGILIFGEAPNWFEFILYLITSMVVAILGFVWFQKTRKGFSDVL